MPSTTPPLFSNPQWDALQQRLSFTIAPLSDHPATMTLTGWEAGITVSLRVQGEREQRQGPLMPSLLPIEFFDSALLQDWADTLPAEVLSRLRCFAANPLGFLCVVSWDRAALELFMDHPLLFALLHQHAQHSQLGLPWLLRHCRMKRVDILKALGFAASGSMVKLFRKVRFKRFHARHVALLRQAAELDSHRLNHLDTVSDTLLYCVLQHPELLKSPLLRQWQDDLAAPLLDVLADIQRMRQHHFISPRRLLEPLRHCRNPQDVFKVHDRLVKWVNHHEWERALDWPKFPEPPLPGNGQILPITDYAALLLEGQQQRHCVAAYCAEIMDGRYYVYRVLAPERATLGLGILRHGKMAMDIVLEQLKGKHSTEVGDATWEAVETWLLGHHHPGGRHD
jgi:hypothetical protein